MYWLGSVRRGIEIVRSQCSQRYVDGIEVEDRYATWGFCMEHLRGILGYIGVGTGYMNRY